MPVHMETAYQYPRRSTPSADALRTTDSYERRALTDDEQEDERRRARVSLIGSRSRREAVLSIPCREHDASAGVPCWHSERSLTRAFCAERWQRALPELARIVGDGMTR